MPKPASITSLVLDRDAQLIDALWEWSTCAECQGKSKCVQGVCPVDRLRRLRSFLRYFHFLVDDYGLKASQRHPTATPTSYDELFKLIRELKSKSNATKDQIAPVFFSQLPSSTRQSAGKTLKPELRLLLMVDCSTSPLNTFDELEAGDLQPPWHGDVTLEDSSLPGFL
ncbi:uncharacterized protein Z519_09943 [Cladophialophora bantiana CBS 173.52]|uniref:Uncharacterized protein n=1 Tax=Cladophialophora bantiana (strain ATCC 10958 / CBS 173.52 / CDC B-1940 / NIH 8579) TaxID=1442370 RepID=A0A0D2EI73_CLAB1|nr:uncharacterized protein Z519_09943 [Cladophialophora bantiana CBS 173.52]KIW89786.1 hypothetical protein Z519_09943 [Cladophialophora bantiana CBS 173.52]